MGSVILYDMKRRVNLTLEGKYNGLNRNMAMHNPDFVVFKGTQTRIEFIVRNTDRKPINLVNQRLMISLINFKNSEVILSAPLTVVDAARGICAFECLPRLIQDVALGTYSYTVSYLLDNNNPRLLNMDQYEQAHGHFEVRLGNHPEFVPTQEFTFVDFRPVNFNYNKTWFISPALRGNMQRGSTFGLHTIAFFLDDFTGSVWIEGSVQEDFPGDNDWFPVNIDDTTELRLRDATGTYAYNIEANLYWVRLKIAFEELYQDDELKRAGRLKKIQFRN